MRASGAGDRGGLRNGAISSKIVWVSISELPSRVFAHLHPGGSRVASFPDFLAPRIADPARVQPLRSVGTGSRKLHYTTTGRPEHDRPELALYLSKEPLPHELKFGAAVNYAFEIPAGARDHEDVAERAIDRDILVYQLSPHMHYRGKHMRFDVRYPDGSSETLLSVPSFNFNWQRRYALLEPKRIPAGSTLIVRAGFDNSRYNPANPDPDSAVYWGEQSFEEMLIGYFLYRELGNEAPGERLAVGLNGN